MEEINGLQAQQGWSDETLGNFALHFIARYPMLLQAFSKSLRAMAEEEEVYAALAEAEGEQTQQADDAQEDRDFRNFKRMIGDPLPEYTQVATAGEHCPDDSCGGVIEEDGTCSHCGEDYLEAVSE